MAGIIAGVQKLVERALARRAALPATRATDALRWFHGRADGLAGLVLEQLGPVLIAQVFEGRQLPDEPELRSACAWVAAQVRATAVYRKEFPRDRSAALARLEAQLRDPAPWIGAPAPAELCVHEAGARFLVRPYDGYATGTFLDHRDHRRRVRAAASGRRVLNLFAYTCQYSVVAALGGAARTVSVDLSKRYLEWGKQNFAANRLDPAGHQFICSDVREYYRRAARQRLLFDLIICDPPSFARVKATRRAFELRRELDSVVGGALSLLAPGGALLFSCNHQQISRGRLVQAVRACGRTITGIEPLPLPDDFAGDTGFAQALWVGTS